ncbi:MAG: (d)CMP kinase [Rhodobacteraceae bacterium]|nr:(d)CMP kinase [Paracoccaceae bacterium]MCY4197346.1 (d)CMP kinase [Paracoccaceae bacterium]
MSSFTVAIDGPAAAGKGTIGHALAEHYGFAHLDTGLLYRAVTKQVLDQAGSIDEELAGNIAQNLSAEDLLIDGLRSAEVGRQSSLVAAMPAVRQALLTFQKEFARRDGGAVLDGRDIGTIIAPYAEVKLFVTASEKVRAGRRCRELAKLGFKLTFEEVLADLRQRDQRDRLRGLAALRKADDALLLDTSKLTIHQAASKAIVAVHERLGTGRTIRAGNDSCVKTNA